MTLSDHLMIVVYIDLILEILPWGLSSHSLEQVNNITKPHMTLQGISIIWICLRTTTDGKQNKRRLLLQLELAIYEKELKKVSIFQVLDLKS